MNEFIEIEEVDIETEAFETLLDRAQRHSANELRPSE